MSDNEEEPQEMTASSSNRIGEHWLRLAHTLTRRLPIERRLHFVADVYSRHGGLVDRYLLVQQVKERLQTATTPANAVPPWSGQSPSSAQPVAPPLRARGQTQLFAPTEQWSESPATSSERRQDHAQTSIQGFQATELVSSPVDAPPEQAAVIPASVMHSPSLQLDPPVRSYLARGLDIRIPAVRIYTNQAADQVARRQRADAVTYGRNILFRAGKYDPATRQGLGLLGHELTHVAQQEGADSEPARSPAPYAQLPAERLALQNEQWILDRLARPDAGTPAAKIPAAAAIHPSPAQSPVPAPRTAASDRPISDAGRHNGPPAAAALTAAQLQQIKDAIYRDLMDRIRTEFERGG